MDLGYLLARQDSGAFLCCSIYIDVATMLISNIHYLDILNICRMPFVKCQQGRV